MPQETPLPTNRVEPHASYSATLRATLPCSLAVLHFFRFAFQWVTKQWPRSPRDDSPDQGFERTFRNSCIVELPSWNFSQPREMQMGQRLDAASGVLHEIDLVATGPSETTVCELKNRLHQPPEKNDVIVFYAKILDYLSANSSLALRPLIPVFISAHQFEESGLMACLGLGIHPIAHETRPLPLLIDNARRMAYEVEHGIHMPATMRSEYEDFLVRINRLALQLEPTWFESRFGYISDRSIVVKTTGCIPVQEISNSLRSANLICARLIREFQRLKGSTLEDN